MRSLYTNQPSSLLCHPKVLLRTGSEVVYLTKHGMKTSFGISMAPVSQTSLDLQYSRNAPADSRSSSVSTAFCFGFATELAASQSDGQCSYKACITRRLFPSETHFRYDSLFNFPPYLIGISYPNLQSDLQYHLSLL